MLESIRLIGQPGGERFGGQIRRVFLADGAALELERTVFRSDHASNWLWC